ncbi:hypothetical protein EMIT0324P_110001 [Pseudomonas chlororaphis]
MRWARCKEGIPGLPVPRFPKRVGLVAESVMSPGVKEGIPGLPVPGFPKPGGTRRCER